MAGGKHDAAALDAITTTAKGYNARLNALLSKFAPVADDFKAKAAGCR